MEVKMELNQIIELMKSHPDKTWDELAVLTGHKNGESLRTRMKKKGINRTNTQNFVPKPIPEPKAPKEKPITPSERKNFEEEIRILRTEKETIIGLKSHFLPIEIKPIYKDESEATAFIVASDWHIEEVVKSSTVNGMNEFNLKIAEERVNRFWYNSKRLVNIFEKDIKIENIVLCLLGDFISGNIHEELLENCSLRPMEAIWKVQNMIAGGLVELKKLPQKIKIVCKSGNHSRINKKLHVSTEYGNSLETYMYLNLAQQFPEFDWVIDDAYHTIINVYGSKIRIHHGTYVKYQGGVGGLTIPANKAIAQWNKLIQCELDIFAHWHSRFDGGNFIINGSLIGLNPFALSIKASYEPPQQTFFLWDKKHKKTVVAPILLT